MDNAIFLGDAEYLITQRAVLIVDVVIVFCVVRLLVTILKAHLHMQLSLQFLVRFSPFDGCERVNQSQIFRRGSMHSAHSLLIHSFTSIRRRKV